MKVQLFDGAYMPVRGHEEDAGLDLRTPIDVTVPKGGSAIIDTLTAVEISKNHYGKLESKSGLNVKHGVVCLGGVIDHGYSGSVVVKIYNLGDEDYHFKAGDKVVQLIEVPCKISEIELGEVYSGERAAQGFGSTGC